MPGTTGTPTRIAGEKIRTFGCEPENAFTQITRLRLVTAVVDDLRGGTDERNASLLDLASECGVLGKEAIAERGLVNRCPWTNDDRTRDESCRRHVLTQF